ncbi:head-tail adaptor protein [Methylobacterium organophilum]|uniref:Head-tail adaptor protein n=1 Tax=Methylobacterium organophilum TaxID=410 RepID=A0ABQ4TDY6_METOR|nr:head-tail adaptor protein [Methylobacterium organophilum]UMY18554.1 head-tail adaptor protein [Methylobacterium organophilum]GJE29503.1 hypothetical protein LKMONMHP_4385 [Methylobacterium organophilum]
MTQVPIGARRRRFVLEQPVDTPDGFGGRIRRYEAGPVLWGAMQALGAETQIRGGRADRIGTHRIALRFRAGITPAMRLSAGPRRFAIRSAEDPDGRGCDLVCLVEEILPEALP